jgi:hypothetical protein
VRKAGKAQGPWRMGWRIEDWEAGTLLNMAHAFYLTSYTFYLLPLAFILYPFTIYPAPAAYLSLPINPINLIYPVNQ